MWNIDKKQSFFMSCSVSLAFYLPVSAFLFHLSVYTETDFPIFA